MDFRSEQRSNDIIPRMKNFLNDKTSYIGLDYPNTDEAFAETKDKKKRSEESEHDYTKQGES